MERIRKFKEVIRTSFTRGEKIYQETRAAFKILEKDWDQLQMKDEEVMKALLEDEDTQESKLKEKPLSTDQYLREDPNVNNIDEVMFRSLRRKTTLCIGALCIALFIAVCQTGYYIIMERQILGDALPTQSQQVLKADFRGRPYKTVHLDLKGAPPRLSYLRKILPILAAAGCDSLLIEYEDMFPYSGKLANLSAGNAYTRQQIKTLLSWAHDLNMEVIPLIQTFGHLEFALKLEEFKHLREVSNFPQEVCPSKDDSFVLIEEMLRQVMVTHKGIRYLHIGADEVFHLAVCSQCLARSLTSKEIYAEYVSKVAEHIRSTYPGVRPIIWDDMIRSSPHLLGTTKLPQLVEPMIWAYSPDVPQLISNHVVYWYAKHFDHIWIAGAFKGASLPTSLLPNLEFRFFNQISWIQFIKRYDVPKIVGYVLTGWSRFDHFAVLCELLPPSLPSLLLNLHLVSLACDNQSIDERNLYKKWLTSLSCPNNLQFTPITLKTDNHKIISCNFPGVDLYEIIINLIELRKKINTMEETLTKTQGWMTKYNVNHNYTNPWYIQDYRNLYVHNAMKDVISFKNYTKLTLNLYFDKHTINEWIEQNIEPLFETLRYLDKVTSKLMHRTVWQRRPLA